MHIHSYNYAHRLRAREVVLINKAFDVYRYEQEEYLLHAYNINTFSLSTHRENSNKPVCSLIVRKKIIIQ